MWDRIRVWLTVALGLAVFVSAVSVVYVKHASRKLFVERTEAYNAEVKRIIAESGKAKQ